MEAPLFQILFDEEERRPLTVSELNAGVRAAVERGFASVWVEGEIVGFIKASSGHWYFNLNDGDAHIKCVCWRGTNYRVRFQPQNGITVRIRGKVTFWEQKGEIKLNVESLEPSGEGALAAAYEQIRAKLESEGLFSDELKRPIPFLPSRVAVITSRTGAAYHDIVNVLTRRAKSVSVLLIPALVQGEGAADSIRRAIVGVNAYNLTLSERDRIDVLIVGRGGGSAEDLWAFNDEMLARAIRSSDIPVISAVGHEIDVTIADLVADLRAATPSAAAELVAGREEDIINGLRRSEEQLLRMMDYMMLEARGEARDLDQRLQSGFAETYGSAMTRFASLAARLTPSTLSAKVASSKTKLSSLIQRQVTTQKEFLTAKNEYVERQMARLDALSPLNVLNRGFSLTQLTDGTILRDSSQTNPGDKLKIRLANGKLEAEVLSAAE